MIQPRHKKARTVAGVLGGADMAFEPSRIFAVDSETLWTADAARLTGLAGLKVRSARFGVVLAQEFRHGMLDLHAKSLVYTTLLSLVPFLAVSFSVLTAFGASQDIEPLLISLLEPLGETGSRVVTGWVVEFVSNVQIGVLGVLGFVVLFYFVLSLVGKIEDALNYIWRVPRGRPLVRRFTDYLSVVLVGPTLIFTAFTLIAAARRSWFVQGLLEGAPLGGVSVLLSWLVPLLVLFGVFTFVYKFLPNTPVRLRSALLGGATASLFWVLAGAGFTVFVAEAPDRVAIYRSFAAAIVFFVWLYVSWFIILVGGLVAYVHQHADTRFALLARRQPGGLAQLRLALSALTLLTRRHLAHAPPCPAADLATALGVSAAGLEEVVAACLRGGFVCRTAEPEGLILARPAEDITAAEVCEVIERAEERPVGGETEDWLTRLLGQRDRAIRASLDGVSLRSLAQSSDTAAIAATADTPARRHNRCA